MAGRGMGREREGASGMVGEGDPPEEVVGEAVGTLPRELLVLEDQRGRPDRGRRARRWNRRGQRVRGDLPKHRELWKLWRGHGLPCWPPIAIAELGWGE